MAKRTPEEEARGRIETAHRDRARTLDLSDLELTALTSKIGNLAALENLNLSQNKLTALPSEIGNLVALEDLNLSGNQLKALSSEIGNLATLETLRLSGNQLTALPSEIGNLINLQTLDLSGNQLTALPETIGNLAALQRLDLEENKLAALPQAIGTLATLEELYLQRNDALAIPSEILGPTYLTENRDNPPAAPADILRYYFRSQTEATRALNEAKIILVGQGGVGKSSLVKRLVSNDFDDEETKTEGIDIVPWSLPNADNAEPVRLNIWDFGGQEIMHATHRFFLSQRSLYLLVIDARQGASESNIQYWLEIVQSYGGGSPVLVVVNKSDEQALELDETRLKIDFEANLRQFIRTSAKSGEGIDVLRAAIAEQLSQLTHIHDTLPESYFAVKGELESLAQEADFVPKARYLEICETHGVTEEQDQRVLLRFLHDLGNVLNFDDPEDLYRVQETNILNPEWVTGGVYRILNDRDLLLAGGGLDSSDVDRILGSDADYPPEQCEFIIDMMRKFELCFAFPGAKDSRLLVPELLNPNEPYLDIPADSVLRFQYAYTVLPGGVLPRFIVRMNHALTDPPVYWRSGVQLRLEGCRATVRANAAANRIHIAIEGPENRRRQALSAVRDSFKAIHNTIPRLTLRERVPMPDNQDVLVDYEHLLRLEENGEAECWPEGANRKYPVLELLNGVEDPSRRDEDRERKRERGERYDDRLKQRPSAETAGTAVDVRKFGAITGIVIAALLAVMAGMAALYKLSDGIGEFSAIVGGVTSLVILIFVVVGLIIGKINEKTFADLIKRILPRSESKAASSD